MSPGAFRPQYTKAPVIVRTLYQPLVGIRMVIQTLPAQLALPQLDKPYTHRHRPEIKVVRVLAVVAHLAQVSEVVLAYCRLFLSLAWVVGQDRRGEKVEG